MGADGTLTIKLDAQTAQQLAELARLEGVTPEQYAAELVAEAIDPDLSNLPPPPGLTISDEDLRVSIEQQRRDIAAGTATLYSHEEVVAGARAILAKARDAKA